MIEQFDSRATKPLISVITVVYNNRDGFAGTAKSVCEQRDASFEWLVIDGGSTDGTVDLIKAHAGQMAYWVSERDKGIYDAMNKGLAQAKGEFCVFMNSGDRFASETTLQHISEVIAQSPADIGMVLGAAFFELSESYRYVQLPRPLNPYILHSLPTSHQAMYFRTDLHRKALLNPAIRIAADYDSICRMFKMNPRAASTNEVVALVWRGLESNSMRYPLANLRDMGSTQRRVLGMSYPKILGSALRRLLPVVAFRLMANPLTSGVTGKLISILRPSRNSPVAEAEGGSRG